MTVLALLFYLIKLDKKVTTSQFILDYFFNLYVSVSDK